MAIHYEILYQDVSETPVCGTANSVSVLLEQNSIVSHASHLVDTIYVYYANTMSINPFTLTMENNTFSPGDIRRVITQGSSGDAASNNAPIRTDTGWTVIFNAPENSPSSATFYFGVGSPATKLKVVIKKQEADFSCSE